MSQLENFVQTINSRANSVTKIAPNRVTKKRRSLSVIIKRNCVREVC